MDNKWIVIIIFVGFINWYYSEDELTANTVDYSNITFKSEYSVTLYSTEWCGYCKKTRRFFEENNIEYQEFDIEKSNQGLRQYQALNGSGVPLIVIDTKFIRGYSPKAIVTALNEK